MGTVKKLSDAELFTLVAGAASILGDGWTCAEDFDRETGRSRGVNLVCTTGSSVHVARDWREKGKLNITGNYPTGANTFDRGVNYGHNVKRYNGSLPSIQVSASRPAKAVAGEIRRRFLPEYLPFLARAVEARDSAVRCHAARDETSAAMIAASGEMLRKNHNDQNAHVHADGFFGDVKVSHDGQDVEIHLRSVPKAVAEAMLRAMAGAMATA